MRFIKSKNLIRVKVFHNVPCDPFIRNVKDEYEAYAFIETQLDFLTFLNQDNPLPIIKHLYNKSNVYVFYYRDV